MSSSRVWVTAVVVLTACDAAFVDFPAADLTFDVPAVDTNSIVASCSPDATTFIAQFNATRGSTERLAIIEAEAIERHPLAVVRSGDVDFPVRYQLGPLQTASSPDQVTLGQTTSLRCDDLAQTSAALGILDGWGVAVECVQWVGADAVPPDQLQPELMDVGCITASFAVTSPD